MFYRRKIILGLLELFEGHLEKIRLQKLLFLFSQEQQKSDYHFIPYKFGCFSYSANADLITMVKKDFLIEDKNFFKKIDRNKYFNTLKESDKNILLKVKSVYGTMNSTSLMINTYLKYPFYAINSLKAEEILSSEQFQIVRDNRPKNGQTILFTIGYEGISLEEYLNKLILNDIKILVDVRNNPLSMKYGFSKNQLKKYCESINIQYLHFPEVGIQSDQRQELKSQEDYDKLFNKYIKENLPKTKLTQISLLNLLIENKRIALTCFEANICQCHRKHLAESIEALPEFSYKVMHI